MFTVYRRADGLVGFACCENAVYNESIVGSRIRVFWDGEDEWFQGKVIRFNSRTQKHSILYDDGDTETGRLEKMQFELLR